MKHDPGGYFSLRESSILGHFRITLQTDRVKSGSHRKLSVRDVNAGRVISCGMLWTGKTKETRHETYKFITSLLIDFYWYINHMPSF